LESTRDFVNPGLTAGVSFLMMDTDRGLNHRSSITAGHFFYFLEGIDNLRREKRFEMNQSF